ncbi:VOC family protein [Brachyspira intermedia]|uniref:VOC family protein n=1 Tax=Brachyspira intermedia TaxID=84377 RepID=UPI0030040811
MRGYKMKIAHIAVWVKDLENIKNFYIKYFNCTCNDKYVNEKKGFESYFLKFEKGLNHIF